MKIVRNICSSSSFEIPERISIYTITKLLLLLLYLLNPLHSTPTEPDTLKKKIPYPHNEDSH